MSSDLNSLTTQALSLPIDQRFELAQRLWESVEGTIEDDQELFAEIDRRTSDLDAGLARTVSHEEVMREVKKVLGE
jgi:putative addiction module component (TIGR02574 family)